MAKNRRGGGPYRVKDQYFQYEKNKSLDKFERSDLYLKSETRKKIDLVPCKVKSEWVKISVMPDINDKINYRIYLLLQMYLLAILVI